MVASSHRREASVESSKVQEREGPAHNGVDYLREGAEEAGKRPVRKGRRNSFCAEIAVSSSLNAIVDSSSH